MQFIRRSVKRTCDKASCHVNQNEMGRATLREGGGARICSPPATPSSCAATYKEVTTAAGGLLSSYGASTTAASGFSAFTGPTGATSSGRPGRLEGRSRRPPSGVVAAFGGRTLSGGGARGYNTSLRELAIAPRPVNYGIRVVPEKSAVVVERFGKFHTILNAGIHFLVPLVDQIAYVWHLKEEAIPVVGSRQSFTHSWFSTSANPRISSPHAPPDVPAHRPLKLRARLSAHRRAMQRSQLDTWHPILLRPLPPRHQLRQ